MSNYVFPGHPEFLKSAAEALGRPESASPAGRIVPLTALAHLCAQAAMGHPSDLPGILLKAAEFRDQIATALHAAELMIADVAAHRGPAPAPVDPEPIVEAQPIPKVAAKGSRNPRESS